MAKRNTTKASKAIDKVPQTGGELAVFNYGEDAGAGFQNQTQDDIQIPILGIMQDMSPQTKKSAPEFIEGAEVGMLFNPVTEELVDGAVGILAVFSTTDHCFTEWIPRKKGGGFVGRHELDSEVVAAARASGAKINEFMTAAGNELVETYYIYGILVAEDGVPAPIILAMTKSKIKVYRKWNTKIRQHMIDVGGGRRQNPPMFANLVRIKSFEDRNANGDLFQNFVFAAAGGSLVESLLDPADARFLAAKKIGELFSAGSAQVDYATQTEGGTTTDGEAPPF